MCRAINCLMHAMRASTREDSAQSAYHPTCVAKCVCVYVCGLVNRSLFSTIHLYLHAAVHPEPEHSSGPRPGRQWAVERLAHTFRYTEHSHTTIQWNRNEHCVLKLNK